MKLWLLVVLAGFTTAAMLNAEDSIRAYDAYQDNMVECTNSDWVDMPDMTISGVGTSSGEAVLVWFSTGGLDATSLGSTFVEFCILRDGQQIAKTNINVGELSEDLSLQLAVSLQRVDRPASGSHTYKVQWKVEPDRGVQEYGHRSLTLLVISPTAGIYEVGAPKLIGESALLQNSPNPFSRTTSISYTLTTSSKVILKIYDSAGRTVRTLVNQSQDKGRHTVIWDGRDDNSREQPTGTYFYALELNGAVFTKRAVQLK